MIRDITLNVGREIDRTLYRDFSGGIHDDHSIDFPATFMECAINLYANAKERIVNNHGALTRHNPIDKEFREIEEIKSVKNGLVRFIGPDFDDVNIEAPVHRYCMACGRRINPIDRFLAVASHKRIDYKDYCNRCQNYLDRSSKIFMTLTKKNEVHTDDSQARKSIDSYFALCDKMLDVLKTKQSNEWDFTYSTVDVLNDISIYVMNELNNFTAEINEITDEDIYALWDAEYQITNRGRLIYSNRTSSTPSTSYYEYDDTNWNSTSTTNNGITISTNRGDSYYYLTMS